MLFRSDIIKVKITSSETFEKDIIESNKSGEGKELLFQALNKTKIENGPKLQSKTSGNIINIDDFFKEIEGYKAEFAMNLLAVLKDEENKDKRKLFNVPVYIEDGFTHIIGSNE